MTEVVCSPNYVVREVCRRWRKWFNVVCVEDKWWRREKRKRVKKRKEKEPPEVQEKEHNVCPSEVKSCLGNYFPPLSSTCEAMPSSRVGAETRKHHLLQGLYNQYEHTVNSLPILRLPPLLCSILRSLSLRTLLLETLMYNTQAWTVSVQETKVRNRDRNI